MSGGESWLQVLVLNQYKPMTKQLLSQVFRLQEEILQKYIAELPDRYNFISDCVDLMYSLEVPENIWGSIPVEHRTVFNYFHGDAVSTLISAIRLCLHGCETDSLALMRVLIETITILHYVIEKNLYDELYSELIKRAPKGKGFSKKFSYETAIRELDVQDNRERLRGQTSSLGSHASPGRIGMSRYNVDGYDNVKFGISIDMSKVRIVLGELASISLYLIRVIDKFFEKSKYIDSSFHAKRLLLEEEYKRLEENR